MGKEARAVNWRAFTLREGPLIPLGPCPHQCRAGCWAQEKKGLNLGVREMSGTSRYLRYIKSHPFSNKETESLKGKIHAGSKALRSRDRQRIPRRWGRSTAQSNSDSLLPVEGQPCQG